MTSERSDALQRALQRRADLFAAVGRVEMVLAAPTARERWLDDVRHGIAALHDALDAHVEITEGDNGLFAEVIGTAPRLAHQIDALRTEHDEIEQALDELLHIDDAALLRNAATSVLGRIVRHRQKGADLLYDAYNVDVGELD